MKKSIKTKRMEGLKRSVCSGFKNKRGQMQNVVILIVFLSLMAIFIPIGLKITEDLNTSVQAQADIPDDFKSDFQGVENRYPLIWDGLYLFLLIVTFVGTFMMAYNADGRPEMFLFFLVLLILFIFVIPFLSNAYSDVSETEALSAQANQFTIIPFVMNNYVFLSVVMFGIVVVAFFMRRDA